MSINLMEPVRLRDALANLEIRSGSSYDYDQGVMVGAVSALMAVHGSSFESAFECVKSHMPRKFDIESIPSAWRDDTWVQSNGNGA